MTTLTSPNGELQIGAGRPTVLINDQLRVMDQSPDILQELRAGRFDTLLELARQGQQVGTDMVDILINHPDLDEVALLPAVAKAVQTAIGCPISLDSRNPAALEASLVALAPHKALINSVAAEPDSLSSLLPLAKRYDAAIAGMPLGHGTRMPKTVEARLEAAQIILREAEKAGVPRDDIVMDGICMATAAEPDSMRVTLETLTAFHQQLGVATVLGIGNAGHGMPDPTHIDLAYLIAAVPWGLDSALVNPVTPGLVESVRAIDFLTARDARGRRYIQHYRAKRPSRS